MDSDLLDLRLHHYHPDARVYASRIKRSEWQKHKPFIRNLHVSGATRLQMLDALADIGFHPTMNQLNTRMSMWNFKVYGAQSSHFGQTRGATATAVDEDLLLGMSSASPFETASAIAESQPEQETDAYYHHGIDLMPALNEENIQADRISDSLGRLQRVSLSTLDPRTWEYPALQEWSNQYSKEMDEGAFMGHIKAEDQREDSEIFEAQEVKIGYEPPPKSLSWGSRSSWSFYKVTLFSRSDQASMTTSHSDSIRKKGKTKLSDTDSYR